MYQVGDLVRLKVHMNDDIVDGSYCFWNYDKVYHVTDVNPRGYITVSGTDTEWMVERFYKVTAEEINEPIFPGDLVVFRNIPLNEYLETLYNQNFRKGVFYKVSSVLNDCINIIDNGIEYTFKTERVEKKVSNKDIPVNNVEQTAAWFRDAYAAISQAHGNPEHFLRNIPIATLSSMISNNLHIVYKGK